MLCASIARLLKQPLTRVTDILYKLVTWLTADTLCSLTASSQTYHRNSPKTSRVLALSNTAVTHNGRPSWHLRSFDPNAPNSWFFCLRWRQRLHVNEFKEGGVVFFWRAQTSPAIWRIRALQSSRITNRKGEGGTWEFCFHARGEKSFLKLEWWHVTSEGASVCQVTRVIPEITQINMGLDALMKWGRGRCDPDFGAVAPKPLLKCPHSATCLKF